MAEPMDIDSDFDNKENSLHHNNVLPFTEKGYEELDVSELNMKLRYSITPAASPMSKSYTANCVDNRSLELGDDTINVTVNENSNLTRSLNSNLTKNDSVVKSLKALPLQSISTEQFSDSNRSTSVLRPLDTTITEDSANVTVTVSGPSDIDENLSLLSSSSSAVPTPEATTPTKDNLKNDGGSSPIMRGIKSVLNMFRSSQSPIPPTDSEDIVKPDILSPSEATLSAEDAKSLAMLASTPIATHRKKEASPTKRNSPHKESIVFNDDLEKELQWKDETTIIFSQERIPIHKLFFQQPQSEIKNANQDVALPKQEIQGDLNSTVEYMDISCNDSFRDRTMTDEVNKTDCTFTGESETEFLDCETTFTKNESQVEDQDKTPVNDNTQDLDLTKDIESTSDNKSGSRLKQIIFNTTQDILDATLSITPEDLLPEVLLQIQGKLQHNTVMDQISQTESTVVMPSGIALEKFNESIDSKVFLDTQETSITSQEDMLYLNQTVDIANQSMGKIEDSNVTATFENLIQPVFNQTVDITNQSMGKIEDSNVTATIENVIQPILDQPVDTTNQSMDKIEESNVTATFENVIQPVLDQTVEIIDSETNIEDEPNVTQLLEKLSSRTVTFDSQHNILDSTSINETEIIEDLKRLTTNHYDLTQDVIQYTEPSIDTANVGEHNSSNLADTINIIHNPLEELVNKSLLNPDNAEESSPKEASMTELAAEIPLPDEDDLDKELNTPVDETDTATLPISLPPDLVDNINVQTEIDMIINLSLEKAKQIMQVEPNSEDKTVLPPLPILNTPNSERGDNLQNKTVTLDSEVIGPVPEVIQNSCVDENQPLTEEPQIVTIDVFPEGIQSLNIDTELKINQAYEFEIQTETVTVSLTDDCEEIIRLSQPMDINESVIGLKPLPDIINQTNIVPNDENIESIPDMAEPVILEQTIMLPENLENVTISGINPEIVPESVHNVVPELLSDVSEITKPENDLTKDVREELPFTSASDEIAKNSVTHGMTEDVPLTTSSVTHTQLNHVDVIPTEHVNANNEKQPTNTNASVSKSADIKTEDDEIILSENNSPFVSVIAENIGAEQNIDVQNIDHRLATAGKVVFTPPASPPIASKGYNFNFDEIDDPFATKTKIRVSPDTPTKAVEPLSSPKSVEKPMPKKEIMNRRKSQPERKKPVAPKRKFNSTFSGSVSDKKDDNPLEASAVSDITLEAPPNVALEPNNITIEDKLIEEAKTVHKITLNVEKEVHKLEEELHKPEIVQPVITSSAEIETDESATSLCKDSKSVSSSDQSAYYTAGTSSNESFHSRNIFNIPEIDDKNFNPFATKSKMRQSPPPSLDIENTFSINSKMRNATDSPTISPQTDEIVKAQDVTKTVLPDDKMETELMEKDGSENLSNITTSSKATDEKNATIKEVNTEDEDTIEGPFLEAEDLNDDDKMSDFDGENIDMMQFNDLPTQGNDENGDNGELFIDAEAFEFLLNQNKNTVVDSGKESLFLKFDPLFAKRISSISSESLVASLNKFQKRQSTPTKAAMPVKNIKSPIAGPSNLNTTQEMDISHSMDMTHNLNEEINEDLNITVSKPMMVVPPAVNSVTPRNKSLTPNRSNRRSLTFTSPAMAVIDRLLSLSGNSSLLHDTTVTHATREQNEADLALTQLRELLAEKEISVYSLRSESKELKDRLTSLESHLKSLEDESQDRLKKINGLNERLAEKTKINKGMAAVVEGCERTIASLISEIAQDKKRHAEERIKLINERDEQTAHLASMEVSFSDLHSKYEKSKQVILNCKANEDAYKKSIKEFEENLTKMQNNYELLKQHATSKLNHANQELEKMNKSHEAEVLKLNAMIKRKDLHITSLEESLAQKTKANEELTAICDELINKVG